MIGACVSIQEVHSPLLALCFLSGFWGPFSRFARKTSRMMFPTCVISPLVSKLQGCGTMCSLVWWCLLANVIIPTPEHWLPCLFMLMSHNPTTPISSPSPTPRRDSRIQLWHQGWIPSDWQEHMPQGLWKSLVIALPVPAPAKRPSSGKN